MVSLSVATECFVKPFALPFLSKHLPNMSENHTGESQYETLAAMRRVVLLGASNLSRTFPTVVHVAQRMFDQPLEFLVAKGHGRSYGQESCLFGKKIVEFFKVIFGRIYVAKRVGQLTR